MAACKFVNVDPMNYVSPLFTLQHILHIYDNSFALLPHELMWQEYEGDQWSPDPRRKKDHKGVVRFQLAFLLRWTNTKINGKIEKKYGICRQHGHNRNNCPNMPSSYVFPYLNVIV